MIDHETSDKKQRERVIMAAAWLISVGCKILLFPSYRSTDFEVHRHWKAVTKHLPLEEWYFDSDHVSTRHTVDYPPGFLLWWERLLANNPLTERTLRNDPDCLALLPSDPPPDTTNTCVTFMRSTVIVGDVILWLGAFAVAKSGGISRNASPVCWPVFLALVLHPALLWLDHVHFQYNGAMIGVWLLSISCLLRANNHDSQNTYERSRSDKLLLLSAFAFASLLTLKHLYLTLAPWYGIYLLTRFCFRHSSPMSVSSFQPTRFAILVLVTLTTLLLPVIPFAWSIRFAETKEGMESRLFSQWLYQVVHRLFPFERGLVHDYWAGNFWAIYAFLQKLCHRCLPTVTPKHTAVMMMLLQIPGLIQAFHAARLRCNDRLLTSMAYCGAASFWVSFHVHEKAILNTLIPLTVWALNDSLARKPWVERFESKNVGRHDQRRDSALHLWLECTSWGCMGLAPLLYEPRELCLKGTSLVFYLAAFVYAFRDGSKPRSTACSSSPLLSRLCALFFYKLHICILLLVWVQVDMLPVRYFGRYEFAPLALTSLSCAAGLFVSFLRLTYLMIHDV